MTILLLDELPNAIFGKGRIDYQLHDTRPYIMFLWENSCEYATSCGNLVMVPSDCSFGITFLKDETPEELIQEVHCDKVRP